MDAAALGLRRTSTAKLAGGSAADNARITESVLRGEPGARRDVVLLNAGAALLVAGAVDSLEAGIDRAGLTIDAGLGSELLDRLRAERRDAEAHRADDRGRGRAGMTILERPGQADEPAATAPSRRVKPNVVAEIAERRRADIRDEMARLSLDDHLAIAAGTRPPRPILDRLAAPGLHVIAEIKRRSPSAGDIADRDEDIVARARAYEAGGAVAISVLCEPHWFGGSIDDLRAVRAAVSIPVLAKEFVVEPIQLPHLRAAGADLVLLLAVLHPAKRLARLVERAIEIGLEPLVEAHDEKELERALATGARHHRLEQPRPADPRRRHRAGRPPPGTRPRRSARRRRVRCPRRRDGRRLAGRRVRRRARRRGPRPLRRPGRRGPSVRVGRPSARAIPPTWPRLRS